MKILVIPDTHVPFHDKKAWGLALRVAKEMKPDLTVLIGDFADFYAVSHFPKNPQKNQGLQAEVKAVRKELGALRQYVGKRCVYLEGNHEWRLARYLESHAPDLFGLVKVEDLFELDKLGWKWVPYHDHYKVGKVMFAHDLGHAGKHAALNTLGAAGHCVAFGHTHRGGIHYGGNVGGDSHFALNVGWLGDASKVDYMHRAKTRDWQLGLGWINMDDKGLAWASFCPMVKGKVCVDGKWVV